MNDWNNIPGDMNKPPSGRAGCFSKAIPSLQQMLQPAARQKLCRRSSQRGAVAGRWWSLRARPAPGPWDRRARVRVPDAAAWVRMEPSQCPASGWEIPCHWKLDSAGTWVTATESKVPAAAVCAQRRAPGDTRVSDGHQLISTCN